MSEFLPPTAPFVSSGSMPSISGGQTPLLIPSDGRSSPSLSVNYLPTKFSGQLVSRKRRGNSGLQGVPKRGGGREAFRADEARMPGNGDEDYDGVQSTWFGDKDVQKKPALRWTKFKWVLFVANVLVSPVRFIIRSLTNLHSIADYLVSDWLDILPYDLVPGVGQGKCCSPR